MRRVLIVIDKYGWSYDTIARGLVRYNDDPNLHLQIASAREDAALIEREHANFDLIFALGWSSIVSKKKKRGFEDLLPFLDRDRLITGMHSHRSWDDYLSTPDFSPPPPAPIVEKLARLRGVNIISRRLFRIFRDAGLTNITLTENGVDTDLFAPTRPVGRDRSAPLVVGFSGATETDKHDDLKGYTQFIQPLGTLANVEVRVLGGRGVGQVPREQMPALYNQIDVYVSASSSEGFSQSVLEAAACGRAVVSSRVGGCEDLIEDGVNGLLVARELSAFKAAIERLEADRDLLADMGQRNRQVVEQRYAWSARAHDWLNFVRAQLP